MSYEAFISDRSCVKISYGIVVSSSPSFEINGYMYKVQQGWSPIVLIWRVGDIN